MKTLKEVQPGEQVTVAKIHGDGALRRRILEMGITKGITLKVLKAAPLGDPIELSVRGGGLSLRKADIELIEIL